MAGESAIMDTLVAIQRAAWRSCDGGIRGLKGEGGYKRTALKMFTNEDSIEVRFR